MIDISGTLQAVYLLGLIIASFAILLVVKKRPFKARYFIPALLGVGFMYLVGRLEGSHRCLSGDPETQWIIPILCYIPVAIYIGNKYLRRLFGGFIMISALILSHHYVMLVHTDKYTGNQPVTLVMNERAKDILISIREELADFSVSNNVYLAEGWLSNSLEQVEIEYDLFKLPVYEIHSLWHTWLTKLYYTENRNQDYWCAGGSLDKSEEIISFRERNQ